MCRRGTTGVHSPAPSLGIGVSPSVEGSCITFLTDTAIDWSLAVSFARHPVVDGAFETGSISVGRGDNRLGSSTSQTYRRWRAHITQMIPHTKYVPGKRAQVVITPNGNDHQR